MKKERIDTTMQSDRWSYLWLAIGAILSLFSTGEWTVPLAAWLSPVFLIRFVRTQKVFRGFILSYLAIFVTVAIAWWNILGFGVPLPYFLGMMAVSTLMAGGIPYLADRLLAPRLKGFVATLVFPLAMTAMEFLGMTNNPLGSFGAQAYTQYESLVLMQLLSITGMWGLTFLVNWFATIVNWAWEQSFDWPKMWRGLALFASVMLLVMTYGSVRLAFFQPQAGTVRVHSLTAVDMRQKKPELIQAQQDSWDAYRQMSAQIQERYFEGTVREARAGAQMVLWPELAVWVASEDEAALLARGRQIAREEGIYLAMPIGTEYQDGSQYENKLIVVDPTGEIVLEHYKYGGSSVDPFLPGDGILRTFETPFGTLSGVICHDTDFPTNIRQAGRNGTDILLSPSLEFPSIDPMHAQMAIFRAIENGVSVVRQADNGLSVVADPYGRTLAAVDHFTTSERVMVAQVPTAGVSTIYSVVGDLFGWLAVFGFVAIVIWAVVRWRKAKRVASLQPEGQAAS